MKHYYLNQTCQDAGTDARGTRLTLSRRIGRLLPKMLILHQLKDSLR